MSTTWISHAPGERSALDLWTGARSAPVAWRRLAGRAALLTLEVDPVAVHVVERARVQRVVVVLGDLSHGDDGG